MVTTKVVKAFPREHLFVRRRANQDVRRRCISTSHSTMRLTSPAKRRSDRGDDPLAEALRETRASAASARRAIADAEAVVDRIAVTKQYATPRILGLGGRFSRERRTGSPRSRGSRRRSGVASRSSSDDPGESEPATGWLSRPYVTVVALGPAVLLLRALRSSLRLSTPVRSRADTSRLDH